MCAVKVAHLPVMRLVINAPNELIEQKNKQMFEMTIDRREIIW